MLRLTQMRRALRKIARLLLAVMLATVLSPSFASEASGGRNGHVQGIAALDYACGIHDRHEDERRGCDGSHHHGCAGHMFGHLVAYLHDAAAIIPPDLDSDFLSEPGFAVLQGFPERLDRPPLTSALA